MGTDPRLYRQFLVDAVREGRMPILAAKYHLSVSTAYRMRKKALLDGALTRLGECAFTAGPKYAHFVDGIDSGLWGESDTFKLSQPGLSAESQGRAPETVRLASGWVHTGACCTWVILPPIPPALAARTQPFGNGTYRYQEKSHHGTAQFYAGKNGASVVLHLVNRDYPDGLESQVPRFQNAEAREWIQELLTAYPGLKVVNRPIWHADPKAHESQTPLPSGELTKRVLGVEQVARERVGPATETNNSPPGPSLETAGIEEARAIAQAPFALADLRRDLLALKETVDGLGNAMRDLVGILKPKPEATQPEKPFDADARRSYG